MHITATRWGLLPSAHVVAAVVVVVELCYKDEGGEAGSTKHGKSRWQRLQAGVHCMWDKC